MKIVICATQRCGSTLFIEDILNTEILGRPKEHFLPWLREPLSADWALKLNELYSISSSNNGVMSVKVMANQIYGIDKRLSRIVDSNLIGIYPSFRYHFQDAIWVWLRRKDVVAQAISRVMAEETKLYHATFNKDDKTFASNIQRGYDKEYNNTAEYNSEKILEYVTSIVLENLTWTKFFEDYEISPLNFIYEDVIRDTEASHLDALVKAAGITERLVKKPRTLTKLGNARNLVWRDRFMNEMSSKNFRT